MPVLAANKMQQRQQQQPLQQQQKKQPLQQQQQQQQQILPEPTLRSPPRSPSVDAYLRVSGVLFPVCCRSGTLTGAHSRAHTRARQ